MGKLKEPPYSYHTFMFPFIWYSDEVEEKKSLNLMWEEKVKKLWHFLKWQKYENNDEKGNAFIQMLDKECWVETTWKESHVVPNVNKKTDIIDDEDAREKFAALQYFHKPVIAAMFGGKTRVVRCFSLLPERLRNKSFYFIKKGNRCYKLPLNSIRLKVYNTEVAVMTFEAENYDYKDLESIHEINDYGRRISPPFLPNESGFHLIADELGVVIDRQSFITPFKKEIMNKKDAEISDYCKEMGISQTIKDLLLYRYKKEPQKNYYLTVHGNDSLGNGKIKINIEPILDDRMFVTCLIRDDEFIEKIREPEFEYLLKSECEIEQKLRKEEIEESINKEGYAYQQISKVDGSIAEKLYSILYIDPSGWATCRNRFMIQKLLEDSVYNRWIEAGTIHAVTHHSCFCITSEDYSENYASVIVPFISQYVPLMELVLVQRSTIIRFEQMNADLSRSLGDYGETFDVDCIKKLMDLQEKYVAFQNELMFCEVTAQEQGIEIYNLMQKSLYIEKEEEKLNGHITNLYEAANVNQDNGFNKLATVFAVIALIWALLDTVLSGMENGYGFLWSIWIIIALSIICYLSFILLEKVYRRNRFKKVIKKRGQDEVSRN